MPRQRTTASIALRTRLLLLALPAIVLFFLLAWVAAQAHRTLRRAEQASGTHNQLAFTLQPLDPAAARTAFEPVASTPSYTLGAFFAGQLYLAGASGLTIFNAGGTPLATLRTGIELPVAPISALVQARIRGASEPQLLAATAGAGLLILEPTAEPNPQAPASIRQLLPADVEARDLTAILPLATGDLLLGTRHRGILLYNGATLTPLPAFASSSASATMQITALAASDSSSYLVGTRNSGIFYVHAGIVDHADITTGLPDNQVEAIAVSQNHAFVGTPTGTADFDLAAPSFRPTRTLAEGLFAHTLSADADTLTIGTLDQGIQQIPLGVQAHLHRASISLAQPVQDHQRVDAILPAADNLYALADGSLLRHTGSAWTPALATPATTLTDRNISALAFAPDGTLYVGFFDRGLDELRPDSTIRHLEDDHLFCIDRLALDPIRQTIAAATADGLVLFDAQGTPRQTLTRRDGLISDHISDVAFTRAGTALATPAGITFLSSSGPESLYAFQGLVNNHVYALAAAAPGRLIAGTLGGISILQSQSVQRNLTVTNSGLKHNWITALLSTPSGDTLIGTYGAGLQTLNAAGQVTSIAMPSGTPKDLIINPNALYATPTHLYAGTLAHGMLVYTIATGHWANIMDGLPSRNVTAFAARAGTVTIGTENGLVRIPEANLP
jgi:ligand-binding sensor domain-containing protein